MFNYLDKLLSKKIIQKNTKKSQEYWRSNFEKTYKK